MKTITITIDGIEYTAPVTVCNPRKLRGSDTFSRTAKVRGSDCARTRFARQTVPASLQG